MLITLAIGISNAQNFALKTNLLYTGVAQAPNLGMEIGLGKRSTLDVWGAYNPWNLDGTDENNKKMVHMIIQPEYRYWLCEKFNGHYFGVHALYSTYNVSETAVPLLFEKEFRYEGNAFGAGVSYGYHWMWGKHWGMEFNIGFGVANLEYKKFDCAKCSEELGTFKKTYIGPTKAGITLVYVIK